MDDTNKNRELVNLVQFLEGCDELFSPSDIEDSTDFSRDEATVLLERLERENVVRLINTPNEDVKYYTLASSDSQDKDSGLIDKIPFL